MGVISEGLYRVAAEGLVVNREARAVTFHFGEESSLLQWEV